MMKTKTSYNKARLRKLLLLMIAKHQPNCCICGLPFIEADLPVRATDQLTEQHLDGDHSNNALTNRGLAHRSCHKSLHTKNNINSPNREFWSQFRKEEIKK